MDEEVSYANWNTTAPQTNTGTAVVPQTYSGVAVVMTKSDLTWRERQMTDRTGHALCQGTIKIYKDTYINTYGSI